MSDADKWNERYRSGMAAPAPAAARVLSDNIHLLTPGGRSLDLAAGRGANALLLAHTALIIGRRSAGTPARLSYPGICAPTWKPV